ncbi:Hypothetical protein mma_2418 [Janthinobacterium sp. Marseille]|nr:Hypothetical protein mma_2418 [Janthinobacterium sp. Marseille]
MEKRRFDCTCILVIRKVPLGASPPVKASADGICTNVHKCLPQSAIFKTACMLHAFITKCLRPATYEKAQVTDRTATGEEDSMDAHEKQHFQSRLYRYRQIASSFGD